MNFHLALLWNRGLERFGNGLLIDPFSSSVGMDRNSYFHGADFCVLGHCTDLWGATGISFLCIVPVIWYTAVLNICTLWESSSEFSSLCRWVCFTPLIILNSPWPLRGENERAGKESNCILRASFWICGRISALMLCGTAPTRKGSLNNDDGDGNENGKKAISLNWQTNNFSRASALFFIHFFAVLAGRLRGENA